MLQSASCIDHPTGTSILKVYHDIAKAFYEEFFKYFIIIIIIITIIIIIISSSSSNSISLIIKLYTTYIYIAPFSNEKLI